ncbi:hypothetical protein LCI18_003697 [Fusarium solani-melongenae]|uniref:Uncharacterized protein n=1 Tax=Fusarium solani subsp. cucurbitae TaxID=2747967 RepID=A0ACD3YUX0_FUSSC|nr:hypothetical protein LCI18_003697 [Fusarium solani-melongenae]
MPWKDGNLLWFMKQHQNQPEMFRTPTEAHQPGPLLFDQILGQMLSALGYLESQTVVHRYICPGNILVKAGSNERGHSFYLSNFKYESFSGATFEPSEVCSRAPEACGLTDGDLVSSRPSAIDLAHAVCEKSRMLVSLRGMGEWDARDRPSAGQKLVELFGEPGGRG